VKSDRRVGGSTRKSTHKVTALTPISAPDGRSDGTIKPEDFFVLAPEDHVGRTIQEQPVLYLFLKIPTSTLSRLTLIPYMDTKVLPTPVRQEVQRQIPLRQGIQAIRLADYNIHLVPNVPYQWRVNLDDSMEERGYIIRAELPKALEARLAKANKAATPALYAEAGLWYDALAAISDLIDAAPDDVGLRQQRASLLQQGGLREVADSEMQPKR
jgi:hypothetical protein